MGDACTLPKSVNRAPNKVSKTRSKRDAQTGLGVRVNPFMRHPQARVRDMRPCSSDHWSDCADPRSSYRIVTLERLSGLSPGGGFCLRQDCPGMRIVPARPFLLRNHEHPSGLLLVEDAGHRRYPGFRQPALHRQPDPSGTEENDRWPQWLPANNLHRCT